MIEEKAAKPQEIKTNHISHTNHLRPDLGTPQSYLIEGWKYLKQHKCFMCLKCGVLYTLQLAVEGIDPLAQHQHEHLDVEFEETQIRQWYKQQNGFTTNLSATAGVR